jgi:predicted Zn-dependent peptidase
MKMAAALLALTFTSAAPQALDRNRIPEPASAPALRVPVWTKSTLRNGADFIVSESHNLPLVSFTITFMGGANQFDAPERRGIGALTAAMMSEGTTTRNADAFSNALQLLGTTIQVEVAGETGSINFQSTAARFPQTLDLVADMLMNPVFPADALERLRAQRLVALNQAKAQPGAIAARAFPRLLYGVAHPLGQYLTEETLRAIRRDDIVAFHKTYFQPGRALITVVGDVNRGTINQTVERSLAAWPRGGAKPAFSYPALPGVHAPTIYLVDRPGAAQSTFAIGNPGPPRNTPDYYALQVMNTILGGMFQSRLNANIREEKGYSYGASSSFAYGKGPGAFRAGGDIVSEKTDAALIEFLKELRGIGGGRPITDEELATAKDALIQRLPGTFASVQAVSTAITTLWTQSLPDDYYQQYGSRIAAITRDDVLGVARRYIDLDHLTIVIVGDRAAIEAPLKAVGIAPIVTINADGIDRLP